MPGSDVQKIPLMANTACQKVWNRNLNEDLPDNDRLSSFGGWENPRCYLLIDNGPVNSDDYTVVNLRWKGNELVDEPGRLHPYIQNEFNTNYHFNPARRPIRHTYTDEELKAILSPEDYKKHFKWRDDRLAREKEDAREKDAREKDVGEKDVGEKDVGEKDQANKQT